MKDERRLHPRIPVNPEFVPVVQGDGCFVQDLSPGGVFVRTADQHPVGSVLRLRFSVLVDDVSVFDVKARVARHSPADPKGLGVEFVDMDSKTKDELERVLALSGLRHQWEEGAEVSRQEWDAAQRALRPASAASQVEFAAAPPLAAVAGGGLAGADDAVSRVFHDESGD